MRKKSKCKYQKPQIKIEKINLNYFFLDNILEWGGDFDPVLLAQKSKSDKRLKKNVTSYNDVLEKLAKLNVISFQWNKIAIQFGLSSAKTEIGLIAQEVEKLFPELVREDSQHFKEIDYGKFIGLLIVAIQKLQKQNNDFKTRLDKLELRKNNTN